MESERGADKRPWRQRLQSLWRLAVPLWLFRDAGQGTVEQRIANYRYNREQRVRLPFYMGKWVVIALCFLQLTRVLSALMERTAMESSPHLGAALLCMSAGIGFAFACVVLTVLLSSYLYLTWVRR